MTAMMIRGVKTVHLNVATENYFLYSNESQCYQGSGHLNFAKIAH